MHRRTAAHTTTHDRPTHICPARSSNGTVKWCILRRAMKGPSSLSLCGRPTHVYIGCCCWYFEKKKATQTITYGTHMAAVRYMHAAPRALPPRCGRNIVLRRAPQATCLWTRPARVFFWGVVAAGVLFEGFETQNTSTTNERTCPAHTTTQNRVRRAFHAPLGLHGVVLWRASQLLRNGQHVRRPHQTSCLLLKDILLLREGRGRRVV